MEDRRAADGMSRRFQCVAHVAMIWLRNARTHAHAAAPRPWLLPSPPDYRSEYLSCVGEDTSALKEEGTSWSMQLRRARRHLDGRDMTVVTIDRPPFVSLQMAGQEIVNATGFCIEMLNEMAKKFNFSYRLVLPYDGNWGSPMANGTFNGMVGMVHRQTVDFALAGFTITHIRDTVIDFTHAFYEEPTTILIPPPREQHNFLAFLEPFSWQVWFLTLASILVVGPVMWVLANIGNLPVLYPHDTRRVSYSMLRYTWDCAFALTAQSMRTRHTGPVRVLHGVWWTFAVILIYTYTGTLIAFLTVPRLTSLINSLEELANQDDVLWTYRAKTAHETLFENAQPPSTYNKIGQLLKQRPDLLVKTDDDGINAVLSGRTAFIKEKSWLDFAMERDYLATKQCRMSQVNQLFFSAGFGWVLEENSPYLQLFNNEILRMAQSGLFTIWRMQYWPRPNECTAGTRGAPSGPKSLHIQNFSGHFFIFGVGLGLALLAFVGERLVLRGRLAHTNGATGFGVPSLQEGPRGALRRHRIKRNPGPLDRLFKLRAIVLEKGSPLVTVTPEYRDPSTPVFALHPPIIVPEELDALFPKSRASVRHTYRRGGVDVRGRPPIR